MTNKKKLFDCVEIKQKAQQEIMQDYEARKGEFSSYSEYLKTRVKESDWASSMWAAFGGDRVKV